VEANRERIDKLEDVLNRIKDRNSGLAAGGGENGGEGSNGAELAAKVIEEIQKNPEKLMRGMMDRHRSSSADRMAERLELDEDQKEKAKVIMEDLSKKMRELWTNRDEEMTREERREQMQKMREEMEQAMEEILTPDQFDKYKEMNTGRGGMGGMFGGRRGGRSSRGGGGNSGGDRR